MYPQQYPINFFSLDWKLVKDFAKDRREDLIAQLAGDCSHDVSNKLRGQLLFIQSLLALEEDARVSNSGQNEKP